jgi:putative acetyltransferase
MIAIIAELPEHRPHVLALVREAFGGCSEAQLIEKLDAGGWVVSSLVALRDDKLVGHILFSNLDVEMDGRRTGAVALAPMAVRPADQRQGIGGRLVRAGLEDVRTKGRTAVVVLGHPRYYSRFGFSPDLARKLAAPYSGPAFMALELERGALAGRAGLVRYPDAFGTKA